MKKLKFMFVLGLCAMGVLQAGYDEDINVFIAQIKVIQEKKKLQPCKGILDFISFTYDKIDQIRDSVDETFHNTPLSCALMDLKHLMIEMRYENDGLLENQIVEKMKAIQNQIVVLKKRQL